MIRHVVLYAYRSDIAEEEIAEVYQKLDIISSRLPGRLSYTWGKYESDEGRNKGFTHCLVADFTDKKARDAFMHDPVRCEFSKQEVLTRTVDGVASIISFDFEWTS